MSRMSSTSSEFALQSAFFELAWEGYIHSKNGIVVFMSFHLYELNK